MHSVLEFHGCVPDRAEKVVERVGWDGFFSAPAAKCACTILIVQASRSYVKASPQKKCSVRRRAQQSGTKDWAAERRGPNAPVTTASQSSPVYLNTPPRAASPTY